MPTLTIIGGPNGAGKTTFAKRVLVSAQTLEFLNADSIASGLSPLAPEAAAVRAARLLLTRWDEVIKDRRDFAVESTLSGRTYVQRVREAKAAGYTINLHYLFLDSVDYSARRVRQRVIKGGHNVPLDDVQRRYLPSIRNFYNLYLPLANHAWLWDGGRSIEPDLAVAWVGGIRYIVRKDIYEQITAKLS